MDKSLFLLVLLFLSFYPLYSQIRIETKEQGNKITAVQVFGTSDPELLSIKKSGSGSDVLGHWESGADHVRFRPVVPLQKGIEYRISQGDSIVYRLFMPVDKPSEATGVKCLYPLTDTVPENFLKFYVEFTGPISNIDLYDHIQLLGANGRVIPEAVLPLQPALWNKEQTLLTLWIDPGRVKRDLLRNRQMGQPLYAGNWYRIVISDDLKDLAGNRTGQRFEKLIYVTVRDQEGPDPTRWKIIPPAPGSKDPLSVQFNEPMDYGSATANLEIRRKKQLVKGTFSMANDTQLLFVPDAPWETGRYGLYLVGKVEDLAGNNQERLFDVDLEEQSVIAEAPKVLSFKIE